MGRTMTKGQPPDGQIDKGKNRSRRLWRWLIVGTVLLLTAFVGAYSYRLHRHAQLILQLEQYYKTVGTVVVYSNRVDRGLDKMTRGQTNYFRRIGLVDNPRENTPMPARLLSRLARDGVGSLESLELLDPQLTAEAAHDLGQVDKLSTLEIRFTDDSPMPVSTEVLAGIAQSKSLEALLISNASLPPQAFTILSDMKSLRELHLVYCDVSLDELSELKKLPNLRSLTLWVEYMNDERLRAIDQIAGLEELTIWSPNVTDDLIVYDQIRQQLSGCMIGVQMGVSKDQELVPWEADTSLPTILFSRPVK